MTDLNHAPTTITPTRTAESLFKVIIRFAFLLSIKLVLGTKAFTIQRKSWDFRGHQIGYEEATRVHNDAEESITTSIIEDHSTPILLLNGFGVGSFHQHRLFPKLIQIDKNDDDNYDATTSSDDRLMETTRKVYGIDYLGQGRSWPVDCDDGNSLNEKGLIYSIDTWADQIIQFIEEIILTDSNANTNANTNTKVHLIGNSVGGYLAVVLAVKRPDLIGSICLLNATPVWGLDLKGWSGHLPPPYIPRKIGRYLFDRIRDPNIIQKYLETAYANKAAFDDTLVNQIRACTEGRGGHAAFASILFSPPATFTTEDPKDFYKKLAKLECDVLLLFGKEDPWCTPAFAKRMFQSLQSRNRDSVHRYIELENVGHCPNHEAPGAVGQITSRWVNSQDRRKDHLQLLDGDRLVIEEPWGTVTANEIDESDVYLTIMERLITTFV